MRWLSGYIELLPFSLIHHRQQTITKVALNLNPPSQRFHGFESHLHLKNFPISSPKIISFPVEFITIYVAVKNLKVPTEQGGNGVLPARACWYFIQIYGPLRMLTFIVRTFASVWEVGAWPRDGCERGWTGEVENFAGGEKMFTGLWEDQVLLAGRRRRTRHARPPDRIWTPVVQADHVPSFDLEFLVCREQHIVEVELRWVNRALSDEGEAKFICSN